MTALIIAYIWLFLVAPPWLFSVILLSNIVYEKYTTRKSRAKNDLPY
jgi:hypothetical protein